MEKSRTKNSVLTLLTSSIRQVVQLILTFVSRTVFIHVLGADYLGLNGLFSNILTILALSELGIGSAISFYLYKPIADKNKDRILALMNFYKVCYRYVGLIMLGAGCAIMPLLPKLVNFDQGLPVNLYLVYFLFLFNTCSTYLFFAYKQIIATASQEQYKIEKYNIIFNFISSGSDIVVLLIFRAYIPYLVAKIVITIAKNATIAIRLNKIYPFINDSTDSKISKSETRSIFNNVFKVAIFKFGSTLFNSTDNIMISIILGTVIVGYYSNYFMIVTALTQVISLIVQSVSAGVGNIVAKEDRQTQFSLFKQLDFMLYFIGSFICICAFQLFNSFIKIWIGGVSTSYVLSQWCVLFICVSFYFDSTTQILEQFRESSGNFNTGKWLQVIGGIVNIFLDIIFGKLWGLEGILAATVISKASITAFPFVVNVGVDVFKKSKTYLIKPYLFRMLITLIGMAIVWLLCHPFHLKGLSMFIIELIITVAFSLVYLILVYHKEKDFVILKNRVSAFIGNRK